MKFLITHCVLCLVLLFSQNVFADVYFEKEPSYLDKYSEVENNSDNDVNHDAYHEPTYKENYPHYRRNHHKSSHASHSRLPGTIPSPGEQVIIVDPRIHAWGAYSSNGKLIRSGLASAGSSWCRDLGRPCRTRTGVFRIYSLGSEDCYSKRFPLGEGGAPMPYCMYFNGGQGIHGSYELAYANISHGCVRVSVTDARWLRYNFSHINTKVIIKPY